MIKLNKGDQPDVLAESADSWTQELLNAKEKDKNLYKKILNRYNHKEIKRSLICESFKKCMYCESKLLHVAHGEIEHIKPKSTYDHLAFEWENLGFACSVCNKSKGTKFSEQIPYINPYIDEPSEFLSSAGVYLSANKSPRGETTLKDIDLNRKDLIEQRLERKKLIDCMIDKYNLQSALEIKNNIMEQIRIEVEKDKEFSMCMRNYVYDRLRSDDSLQSYEKVTVS